MKNKKRHLSNDLNESEEAQDNSNTDARSRIIENEKNSNTKLLLPIILLAILVGGYYLLSKNKGSHTPPVNTEMQIEQFLSSEELDYMDNKRSEHPTNESRDLAIKNFKNKEYRKAGENFAQIDRSIKTTQDNYYQAYSQLRAGQTMDAVIGFGKVLAQTNKGDNYHHEALLYQILSIIQLKDHKKAKTLYNQLQAGSSEQKKLKNIIESLQ